MTAAHYVQTLGLQPHPEGGYFAETYRSAEQIPAGALPVRFGGARAFGTAIYFLLERRHVSRLHRIGSDEVWHFYAGDSLDVFVIQPDATLTTIHLGNQSGQGDVFQAVVPAGCWFGAKLAAPPADRDLVHGFSLVGCTVAPGFDFADFELADRAGLLLQFPQHRAIIEALT